MRIDLCEVDRVITMALAEDIGRGDITSRLVLKLDHRCSFTIAPREPITVSGIEVVGRVFALADGEIDWTAKVRDGQEVKAGTIVMEGKGAAIAVLTAERVALNLLQHMSGIATLTSHYVKAIAGTNAKILDTRKTTPGLRELEKYAVRCGGGYNHRMRLDDGVLIKDNHIAVCGSITNAVAIARANTPFLTKVEVECDTLEQVKEAVAAKADVIMLDNMDNTALCEAVRIVNGKVPLEASGGVSLDTVHAIAETGVDFISVGKLTHSAPNVDIGLDIVL